MFSSSVLNSTRKAFLQSFVAIFLRILDFPSSRREFLKFGNLIYNLSNVVLTIRKRGINNTYLAMIIIGREIHPVPNKVLDGRKQPLNFKPVLNTRPLEGHGQDQVGRKTLF
jgi:hypothetical protein